MNARLILRLVLLTGLLPLTPAAAQSDPLVFCADALATYSPRMGTQAYPVPAIPPLPPARQPWSDPTFGTCVVRVTDRAADFEAPIPGLKNEYARVQAFNADETLIMVRGTDASWYLYDAQTLEPVQSLDFALDEPRWDALNPLRFSYSVWFDGVPQIMVADLTPAGDRFEVTTHIAHNFRGDLPPAWNSVNIWRRWEGSPSYDGRTDAFLAEDSDFITRGLFTYDWQTDQVIGLYTVPHGEVNEPDNIGVSPLGDYVLAHFEYCEEGMIGTYEEPCGPMIYTRDLSQGWGIARIAGHGDMALDAQGREVMVYQDVEHDQIAMVDLQTGALINLLPLDFSTGVFGLHISGRASERPGWVAVSVQPEAPSLDFANPFWMVGTVFALELKENPRVIQLAHHYSIRGDTDADYFAEPQVTVNRDFTRLLFTSNWGNYGTDAVEMVMIALPEGWLDRPF